MNLTNYCRTTTDTHRRHTGFTLVELAVAMAIALVLLVAVVGVLRSTGDEFQRLSDGISAEREARAVLAKAGEDLAQAVRRNLLIEEGSEEQPGRLGILSLQSREAQAKNECVGDLCAVVYYRQDLAIGARTVPCLMRGFRSSEETFAAVEQGTVNTLYEARETDDPIAFGVYQFELEALVQGTTGAWVKWQPVPSDVDPETAQWPDVIKIRVRIAPSGWLAQQEDISAPQAAVELQEIEVFEITRRYGHEG